MQTGVSSLVDDNSFSQGSTTDTPLFSAGSQEEKHGCRALSLINAQLCKYSYTCPGGQECTEHSFGGRAWAGAMEKGPKYRKHQALPDPFPK
jgi:hypothetical protein